MNRILQLTSTIAGSTLLLVTLLGCGDSGSPEPETLALPQFKAGTASVTYTTPENSKQLTDARAVMYTNHEGEQELRLFMSDQSLDGVLLTDHFGDDELHGWVFPAEASNADEYRTLLNLRLDPDAPEDGYNGDLYPRHSLSMGGKSAFESLNVEADRVSGSLNLQDMFEGRMPSAAFTASGTFDAPLTHIKQPTPISGVAIADSPQAKSLNAALSAMREGDLNDIREAVTEDAYAELQEMIDASDSVDEALGYIQASAPTPEQLQANYENDQAKLFVAGKQAMLVITVTSEGMTSTSVYRFLWQGGDWRMN